MRIVVAGAEKLDGNVRNDFALKFHKPIYEGYGATEIAPLLPSTFPMPWAFTISRCSGAAK
ncbi:hypothetical protein HORIV_13580 [Vreelandella olivaria]|uniref:Uncharacterized protein n=1 Tax=Vreelandella olivaria TaxID=390919 RepID=A0ABM7GET8_9GAMM|nr:hypothetical protein HORIV_13580 [Halomonas olivaria]